jgi:leucyl aminopeptidase
MNVALGQHAFGCFSNSNSLWSKIEKASYHTGERSWRFPLLPQYFKDLKSNVADMKNSGARAGGACVAASFLART